MPLPSDLAGMSVWEKGQFAILQELQRRKAPIQTQKTNRKVPPFGRWLKEVSPSFEWDWPHLLYLRTQLLRITRQEARRLAIFMPPRHGKLLANDTPILTPLGWRTHGELQIGDFVFHPSGKAIRVVGVSEPAEATIAVVFTNGERIVCNEAHEWTVFDRADGRWKTLETREFLKTTQFRKQKQVRSKGRSLFLLPDVSAVQFPEAQLPMAPYVFGAWLGDGSANKPAITHTANDSAVIEGVVACGYAISTQCVHGETGCITTYFSGTIGNPGPFMRTLTMLGVRKNKHIPAIYKQSSKEQRLELLAGLIDTDGHVEADTGRVRIVTASVRLADDIAEVIEGMGWRSYITTQQPTVSSSGIVGKQVIYTVGFQPTCEIPTRLARKKIAHFALRRRVGIFSVERLLEEKRGKCIHVDSPDGLYLAGRKLVPTHNSEAVTVRYVAWFLERFPEKRVVIGAYSQMLANKFSRKVRRIVRTRIPLSKERNAVEDWETEEGGGVRVVGVGGGITGQGADLIIIDDPVKNREEAESEAYRERCWDWYRDDLYTRLEPGGAIVLIMTRWNYDDLAGRLKKSEEWPEWIEVNLPAEAEENDPLGRAIGAALCPARFDEVALAGIKKVLNASYYSLYQQRPTPSEGGTVKINWFRRYSSLPVGPPIRTVQSWDTANKAQIFHAPWVCETWAEYDSGYYLIDVFRERLEYPAGKRAVYSQALKFNPDVVLIEDKSSGQSLLQEIQYNNTHPESKPEEATVTIPVVAILPHGDKVVRASVSSDIIESGLCWLPEAAPWLMDFEEEVKAFPSGATKDQVDAMSQFLSWVKEKTSAMLDDLAVVRQQQDVAEQQKIEAEKELTQEQRDQQKQIDLLWKGIRRDMLRR